VKNAPLSRILPFADQDAGLGPRRRKGLFWFLADGVASQASECFQGDYVVLFALAVGAGVDRIGLLASAVGLCSMAANLPGAALFSRMRRRKGLILLSGGGFSRVTILALAFLPALTGDPSALFWTLLALRGVQAFANGLISPGWTSLVADLVPPAVRGRYFAFRNIALGIVSLAFSPLAGWVVKTVGGPEGGNLRGYQVIFLAAFLLGMIGTASYSRIPEPPRRKRSGVRPGLRGLVPLLRRNPAFFWLCATSCLWGLSLGVAGSFYNVFLVRVIGGSAATIGVNVGLAALASLIGLPLFGRLTDRRGSRKVYVLTGLMVSFLPALWLFVREPFHTYPINAVSGFLWAGYNLASFNLLLEICPAEDRETAVACYQTLVSASGVAGPLLGGALIGPIGYLPVFCLSGAGRLVAMVVFLASTGWLLHEGGRGSSPGASTTAG